jgi:L-asparaginase
MTMIILTQVSRFVSKTSLRRSHAICSYSSRCEELMGKPLQTAAGLLYGQARTETGADTTEIQDSTVTPAISEYFIPQVSLHEFDGQQRKRVLLLCTGGTLTMSPDPKNGGALSPVQGALIKYLKEMRELHDPQMPEIVAHEYQPFYDSSDLGPADWALLANDIKTNYLHFDGFVVCMGTDTMAYTASALSFMLENLGKPVVFTGSQIPLCEPYNDARRNLIMALIFASRDTINEVSIFFHDRLLRACRATKVNTHRLMAFDSPNFEPLAKIGITIDENEGLTQPPPRGALKVHTRMDTRLLTIRLVPGFDDGMIRHLIESSTKHNLKALVLQLYGTGNIPSVKHSFVQTLADATAKGILVVAGTQCHTGNVMMGHYATGRALQDAGVVSACDMTPEATACKIAYLFGRGDLTSSEVGSLMDVSLRGEVTPSSALPPPPLATAYDRIVRMRQRYF